MRNLILSLLLVPFTGTLLSATFEPGWIPAPDACFLYVHNQPGPGGLIGVCIGTCDDGTACTVKKTTQANGNVDYVCKCGDAEPSQECNEKFTVQPNGLSVTLCWKDTCTLPKECKPVGGGVPDGTTKRACECKVPPKPPDDREER